MASARPGGDAGGGPPPAGVGGGDTAPHRVIEQNGDAVPGEDGQTDPRPVGDEAVGFKDAGGGGVGQPVVRAHPADPVAVDLVVLHQGGGVGSHGGAEAAEVLGHMGGLVPPAGPQVQTVPGGGGDAPQPGGEAVDAAAPRRVVTGKEGDRPVPVQGDVHASASRRKIVSLL